MPGRNKVGALLATALLVVALDQVSKAAVLAAIGSGDQTRRVDIAGGWLALDYTENRGVAFGLFATAGPWLAFVPIIVLVGLVAYSFAASVQSRWETFAVGAIVGGALGNVIDRLRSGYVVDYIAVGAWPNFNLADSAITIGVILLLCGWIMSFGEPRDANTISRELDADGPGTRTDHQRAGQ